MTDSNYTHMTMVVDRSGSMGAIRDDAQGGINQLIEDQKKVEGKMTFTLVKFDHRYDTVYNGANISEVESYTLVPRGMTALYDAVGRAIVTTGEFLGSLPEDERPGNVLFVIVTDGMENSSKEYTAAKVKEMISEQESKYSWDFNFVAANIDASSVGSSIGVNSNVQYSATGLSTNNLYQGMSKSITNARVASAASGVGGQTLADNGLASSYEDEDSSK